MSQVFPSSSAPVVRTLQDFLDVESTSLLKSQILTTRRLIGPALLDEFDHFDGPHQVADALPRNEGGVSLPPVVLQLNFTLAALGREAKP